MTKPLAECANAAEILETLQAMLANSEFINDRSHIQYWFSNMKPIDEISALYGHKRKSRRFNSQLQRYLGANLRSGALTFDSQAIPGTIADEQEFNAYTWLLHQLDPGA